MRKRKHIGRRGQPGASGQPVHKPLVIPRTVVTGDELLLPLKHTPGDLGSEFEHLDVLDEAGFTPEDYCNAVRRFFVQYAHDVKVDGADLVAWDNWSLALNKMWTQRCHAKHDDHCTQAALVYWWNRNEYLRLLVSWPLHKEVRKRRLNTDATAIRSVACGTQMMRTANKRHMRILKNYSTILHSFRNYFEKVAKEEAVARDKEAAHALTAGDTEDQG